MKRRYESIADFKARLAAMLRRPDEPILRNKAHPCLVRKTKTYGYNPWDKRTTTTKGKQ